MIPCVSKVLYDMQSIFSYIYSLSLTVIQEEGVAGFTALSLEARMLTHREGLPCPRPHSW